MTEAMHDDKQLPGKQADIPVVSQQVPRIHWVLEPEHQFLAAHMADAEASVLDYGDPKAAIGALRHGVGLTDLISNRLWLISGSQAESFCAMVFASPLLSVGQIGFAPMLSGDGRIIATPLLARAGDTEFLVMGLCVSAEKQEGMKVWMDFVSKIADGDTPVFTDLSIEEKNSSLYPLALVGPMARAVLSDYVEEPDRLSQPGCVNALTLDKVPSIVMQPAGDVPAYICLIPARATRVFFRSFLSFQDVIPVGMRAFKIYMDARYPIRAKVDKLKAEGRIRTDGGFIGARALDSIE